MISIQKLNLNGIPTLKIEKDNLSGQPLPLVLFWHGVTSVKERNLYYGYLLAEEGFRVIMPDALMHGERRTMQSEAERQAAFFQIVLNSIKETKEIRQYCEEQNWMADGQFSLAGTSMGAIITLAALTEIEGIQSAVALMGTPYLVGFARHMLTQIQEAGMALPYTDSEIDTIIDGLVPYDLSRHPEKIRQTPLLFWHGKKDPIVPYSQSRLFYDSFKNDDDMLIKFMGDQEAGHVVTQEGALALRDWFVTHAKRVEMKN